jgi:hypothetical protein
MSRDDEPKREWETPERQKDAVSGRRVTAVITGALILFTCFVLGTWAQLQARERHLNPAGPFEPPALGKAEINIVNTGLIPLDTRAEEERERQRERLHGYGWVDRDGGVVHVPIEQAMERVVSEQARRRDGGTR